MSTIELADFPSFTRNAAVSRWLRLALALVAILLAVVAALAAPRRAAPSAAVLPAASSAGAVVEVAASISWGTDARLAATLRRLPRGGGGAGLIPFSGTAFQAPPPGTPVA